MSKSVSEQKEQLHFLYEKMEHLMNMLDSIDPDLAGIEEIDRLIKMLDEIESKCRKFRNHIE